MNRINPCIILKTLLIEHHTWVTPHPSRADLGVSTRPQRQVQKINAAMTPVKTFAAFCTFNPSSQKEGCRLRRNKPRMAAKGKTLAIRILVFAVPIWYKENSIRIDEIRWNDEPQCSVTLSATGESVMWTSTVIGDFASSEIEGALSIVPVGFTLFILLL